jgi:hypothetical protein
MKRPEKTRPRNQPDGYICLIDGAAFPGAKQVGPHLGKGDEAPGIEGFRSAPPGNSAARRSRPLFRLTRDGSLFSTPWKKRWQALPRMEEQAAPMPGRLLFF